MSAKKLGQADAEDLLREIPERGSEAAFHRVNETNPLAYPKCLKPMKIISLKDDQPVEREVKRYPQYRVLSFFLTHKSKFSYTHTF
jgi:hypothetical protein